MTDLRHLFHDPDAANPFGGDLENLFGGQAGINPFGGIDLRNVFAGGQVAARAGSGRDPLDSVPAGITSDTMPPPILTLGDVVLPGYGFAWGFRAGVAPYVMPLRVTRSEHERLGLLRGAVGPDGLGGKPVSLRLECSKMRGPAVFERIKIEVDGLYLLEPENAQSPFETTWAVADRRWTWARRTWSRRYNVTRRMNEAAIAPDAKAEAAEFELIARQRYLRWSLDHGLPWTARKIVLDLLRDLVPLGLEDRTRRKGAFVLENLGGPEVAQTELLTAALAAAEYDLFVDRQGRVVLYDVGGIVQGDRLTPALALLRAGGGWALREDLRQLRPERVDVRFVKEQELRFAAVEEGATTMDRSDTRLGMVNVLPLPANVVRYAAQTLIALGDGITIKVPLQTITRGTWVTVDDALALWNADGSGKPALTLEKLRRLWFRGRLELDYGDAETLPDAVWLARIAALRQHYRQTYRLSPRWMEVIADWAPVRAGIVDHTTGYRQPSEAQGDHCIIWTMRPKANKSVGRGPSDQKAGTNISAAAAETGVPARLQVVDKELGVVRIAYHADLSGALHHVVPSRIDNIPSLSLGAAAAGNSFWHDASLTAAHNISVIITAVLADDPLAAEDDSSNERQRAAGTHTITVRPRRPAVAGDTFGPPVVILSTRERAVFRWAAAYNANQAVDLSPKHELVNGETLQAIAEAEATREYQMWQDRLAGTFVVEGYHASYEPFAGIEGVTVAIGADGEVTTTFDATKHFTPALENMLPAELRRRLLGQVQ